jgi:hypothetical protein
MKTHLPGGSVGMHSMTLCGKTVWMKSISGPPRATPLKLIDRNALVDLATCQACQRVDDAQSVKNYRRECKAAGIEP